VSVADVFAGSGVLWVAVRVVPGELTATEAAEPAKVAAGPASPAQPSPLAPTATSQTTKRGR
jgi:hypothetical protein